MAAEPLVLYIGDLIELRKPHPCGSHLWSVVRLGADIGIRCQGCDHKVLVTRRTIEKRLKRFVRRGEAVEISQQPEDGHAVGAARQDVS